MTAEQRAELEAAQRRSKNVRHWKRYQAVLLRADGMPVAVVAQTLGCSQASVSNWTTAWREGGVAGVREDDCLAFIEELGKLRPDVPKLLIWDNAPPHHPKRVLAAAERFHITIAWLPFRAPELNPCEDLWRLMKAVVAANRCAASLAALAAQAVAWLAALSPYDRLRPSGLLSAKFQWLST